MTELTELRIPHMGSVENAKVVDWLVAEGASFKAGQGLCEIETDKTVTVVEAESDGVLARRDAQPGDEMKVGDRIGYVAPPGTSAEALAAAVKRLSSAATVPAKHPHARPQTSAPPVPAVGGREGPRLSPLVRRLAAEHGVDPARLLGTGPGGKITPDDVLRAAGQTAAPAEPRQDVPVVPGYEGVAVEPRPNSARRRAIARRLLDSAQHTATLTADMEVDLTALLAARAALNQARADKGQPGASVLSFVVHAVGRVLRLRPEFNATYTDSHYLLWKQINIGIAVDTAEGLVVPVIRDADRRSVVELDSAIRSFAERARNGQLPQAQLEGGTFTVSNPGSLGPVLRAEAVLNPPQVALLGVPAVLHAPVAVEDGRGSWRIEVRPLLRPSLTFDHRALDGGQTVGFLKDLKRILETVPGVD